MKKTKGAPRPPHTTPEIHITIVVLPATPYHDDVAKEVLRAVGMAAVTALKAAHPQNRVGLRQGWIDKPETGITVPHWQGGPDEDLPPWEREKDEDDEGNKTEAEAQDGTGETGRRDPPAD